jgi:hypothetical protein
MATPATGIVGMIVLAAACSNQTTWIVLPTPVAAGPVNGLVLDAHERPLPDQIVAIGGDKTTSDGDGRFSFVKIPVNYDLVIASPDAAQATVYQGLTRRDPIVVHRGDRVREPAHKAELFVTLVGSDGGLAPWQVHFVSARALASIRGQAWAADGGKSKNPEPMVVKWDGAGEIAGVLMAHAMKVVKLDIPLTQFAQQPVSLRAGQTVNIELHLAKAPVVRRPSPVVAVPKEDPGFDPVYIEEYRLPGAGFAMHGPGPTAGAYEIPDLRGFGLQLCGDGFQWNPYLHSRRVQCGADPGKLTSLALPSPPVFTSPTRDTLATPGMPFAWSAVPDAVYRLTLASASGKPTVAHPRVDIITSRTTAAWPDLPVVGIRFPRPLAAYAAVVGTQGPYRSMDDLVSPQGLGDRTPPDRWSTESKELSIPVQPPLGKEEAACKFRETVLCGASALDEYYRLSVINRKIQRYPDFAAAANIHCVSDCEGARAYTKAYAEYLATHPGFDDNEPLPVAGEEPQPPREMFQGRRRAWSGGR